MAFTVVHLMFKLRKKKKMKRTANKAVLFLTVVFT